MSGCQVKLLQCLFDRLLLKLSSERLSKVYLQIRLLGFIHRRRSSWVLCIDVSRCSGIWRHPCWRCRITGKSTLTKSAKFGVVVALSEPSTSNRIADAYAANSFLESLIFDPYFKEPVAKCVSSWRRVVAHSLLSGIPAVAFGSSLSYYDGLRSPRLPATLVQGQRDFFGSHSYKRIDRPGTFHTLWSGDRAEVKQGSTRRNRLLYYIVPGAPRYMANNISFHLVMRLGAV